MSQTLHDRVIKSAHCRWGVLVLMVLIGLWTYGPAFAATSPSQTGPEQVKFVRLVEDRFYLTRYDKEPMEERLARIETTVFGEPRKKQSLTERISRLQELLDLSDRKARESARNDFQPLKESAQQPPEQRNAQPRPQPAENRQPQVASAAPLDNAPAGNAPKNAQAPARFDYPAVTEVEQQVFGRSYAREELSQRLERLELAVFDQVSEWPLSDRVDHLRMTVLGRIETRPQRPQTVASSAPLTHPGSAVPPGYNPYNPAVSNPGVYQQASTHPSTHPSMPPGAMSPQQQGQPMGAPPYMPPPGALSADFYSALDEAENQILRQRYSQEPVHVRLDRLETHVFNHPSPDMEPEDRLHRVIAVAAADGHNPGSDRAQDPGTFRRVLPILLMILPLLLL